MDGWLEEVSRCIGQTDNYRPGMSFIPTSGWSEEMVVGGFMMS